MRTLRLWLSVMFVVGLASCQEDCDTSGDPGGGGYCCKVCEDSKACGDSCISISQTCHQTGGCACNGYDSRFTDDPEAH